MRVLGVIGVVCFAAAPVMGSAVNFQFDIVAGSLTVDVSPDGVASPDPVTVSMGGTFGMTIYASDGHIGESDTFVLSQSNMHNTDVAELTLMGLATALIPAGGAQFLDFAPVAPGHIGPGGLGAVDTDVYVEVVAVVTGVLNTTLDTRTWAGVPLDFDVVITTSARVSDTVAVNIHGTFGYEIGVTAITQTLTLDLIVDVAGTAHYPPEPALGGLCALGVAGAGSWLRRRRQVR